MRAQLAYLNAMPALEMTHVEVMFSASRSFLGRSRRRFAAVRDVSLTVRRGETVALVGESGSGKTTLARAAVGLVRPTRGDVRLGGASVLTARGRELQKLRRRAQMVFQDPYSSLNPAWTITAIVSEPLRVHGESSARTRDSSVCDLLELVGLDTSLRHRRPYEFSGGQRQRIAIARALALHPDLVIMDEPLSALDASTKIQIVDLLRDLQERLGLAYLFVAHDLAMVSLLADQTAVMHMGRIVEIGPTATLDLAPLHPYTEALVASSPIPDPALQRNRQRMILVGDPPSPFSPPSGCLHRTRCPIAIDRCAETLPALEPVTADHLVACHVRSAPIGEAAAK